MAWELSADEGSAEEEETRNDTTVVIKRLADAANGGSEVAADLHRALSQRPNLVLVLFYFDGEGKTHRYRAADLAEHGWHSLVPMCQKAMLNPARHRRELLTVRSSVDADSQSDDKCVACQQWVPEHESQQVSLIDYAPAPRLAVYRASRREVQTWESDTLRARSCRFCLAAYADITHTEQCELTHAAVGR